jgi:phosphoribosylamine-glycine ligase
VANTALPQSVLVVGSGGREHALVRALLASPIRARVICAPGNAGIAQDVACFDVAADDYSRPETREEARSLMRALIGERLHGQVLHTRIVLRELSDL